MIIELIYCSEEHGDPDHYHYYKIECTCNNINSNLEACRNVFEVNNKMIKSLYEVMRGGRSNSYL